jgi:ABC-type multidrug transport system fused ATPase/permease subunit
MNYIKALILGFPIYPASFGLGFAIYSELLFLQSYPYGVLTVFFPLVAISVAAAYKVHSLNFYKYDVPFTSDWQLTLILLILFGYFTFPVLVYSTLQIKGNKARKKSIDYRAKGKSLY